MSMFWCAECAGLRDSDDGCEEVGRRLICVDCADEMDLTDGAEGPTTKGQAPQ